MTPASRCQDHTTSPSVASLVVSAPLRPPHPRPDVRETPLCVGWTGCGRYRLICNFGKSEYFCQRGFTDFWVICPSGRFVERIEKIDFYVQGRSTKISVTEADRCADSTRRGRASDRLREAIHSFFAWQDGLLRFARNDGAGDGLSERLGRMARRGRERVSGTPRHCEPPPRHCERSEAIHSFFAARWIASLRSQ